MHIVKTQTFQDHRTILKIAAFQKHEGLPKTRTILWTVFVLYILVSGIAMTHHELWGDEVHSWNISKGSGSYADLVFNRRYEGHPPGWYSVLWTLSRFTHNTAFMQVTQWTIAALVVSMILFFSPLPLITKTLLPFGYFFIFEYGVFSRNYALGILLACGICCIIRKEFRWQPVLYYVLLFCLSNIHLLALLLAVSLHLYFLFLSRERKKKTSLLAFHWIAGLFVLLPAAFFIFPPSDSQENMHFWMSQWTFHRVIACVEAPLRAFLPFPAWWNFHFWNTEFLISAKESFHVLKVINPLISAALIGTAFYILRKNRKSLALFAANLLLSGLISISVFPLDNTRYAGFIFISFIVAFWLYCYEEPVSEGGARLVNSLLVFHLLAGAFPVIQDIRLPFSNLFRVKELIDEVPANEQWVTDYWTMNGIVAYTDKPAYCVDMQREVSFVVWGRDLAEIQKNKYRYSSVLGNFFRNRGLQSVYMISLGSPLQFPRVDTGLAGAFRMELIDKREGAIEKGSNLYLYRVSPL